jgi:hypothetical protein
MIYDRGQGEPSRSHGQPSGQPGGHHPPRQGGAPAQRTVHDQYGNRPQAQDYNLNSGQAAQNQERPPRARRPAPEPTPRRRSRAPLFLVLLLLLGGGAGWYFLNGPGAEKPPTQQELRIADRQADPKALTEAEVFPSGTVAGAGAGYTVLKTQAATDCGAAAGGAVAEHLSAAGCTQVVRATLETEDKVLVITAGVFNLESQEKAEKAASEIKKAIDQEKGRFGGLVAGGSSDIIARASASLTWDVHGHFLVYCVIAHSDGSAVPEGDSRAQTIRTDLVERHIEDVVIQKRQNDI